MSSLPNSAHPLHRPSQASRRPLPELPPEASTTLPASMTPPRLSSPSAFNRRPRAAPRLEPVVEVGDRDPGLLHDGRLPPPEVTVTPARPANDLQRKESSPILATQQSLPFEEDFGPRGEASDVDHGPKERAVVVAEVKTNVFVADEMAFMNGLSEHLSHRYARPISSIAVTLQHGACLIVGASLDPAYLVAVHALPELVQTATNKRSAALLQRHIQDALGVVPARGIIRFVGVSEGSLATGGKTVAGELAEMRDKDGGEHEDGGKGQIRRRRTVRAAFSRLRHGPGGAQQPAADVSAPVSPARAESLPSQDAGSASAEGQLKAKLTAESPGEEGKDGAQQPKGLRHERSFAFIQSLFGVGSKPGAESSQGTFQKEQ